MSIELKEAPERGPANSARADSQFEEKLLPLLQGLLTQLRRSRDTPLQFGIDSEGVAGAALQDFLAGVPVAETGAWQDWPVVAAALDRFVERFLQDETKNERAQCGTVRREEPAASGDAVETNSAPATGSASHPLAAWLERCYTIMRHVQPQAIDVFALRVEGFQDRDIAARLGLGLRLVRRIVHEARANWAAARETR